MILISKKRVKIILSCIFISLFAFTFQIASKEKENTNTQTQNTLETVATPVSGKTIVVDARSSENQMKEQKVVMEQQKLKQI